MSYSGTVFQSELVGTCLSALWPRSCSTASFRKPIPCRRPSASCDARSGGNAWQHAPEPGVLILTGKGRRARDALVRAAVEKTPLGVLSDDELRQLLDLLNRAVPTD